MLGSTTNITYHHQKSTIHDGRTFFRGQGVRDISFRWTSFFCRGTRNFNWETNNFKNLQAFLVIVISVSATLVLKNMWQLLWPKNYCECRTYLRGSRRQCTEWILWLFNSSNLPDSRRTWACIPTVIRLSVAREVVSMQLLWIFQFL